MILRYARGALAALLIAGCASPTQPEAPGNVVGRFELVSVSNRALPVALPVDGPPRILLIADTLLFRSDKRFERRIWQQVIGPSYRTVLTGEYSTVLATVILIREGTAPLVGRFEGGALTMGAEPYVYRRSCWGSC